MPPLYHFLPVADYSTLCGSALVSYMNPEEVKKTIVQNVQADGDVLGFSFTEVASAEYVCKEGEWLVALAYSPDLPDYHWWRRNDDETWCHKPGSTPVKTVDSSGNTIYDPGKCNRGYYSDFLGYFVVSSD